MDSSPFVKIAQSAANDETLLRAIQEAYTEVGQNKVEECLRSRLDTKDPVRKDSDIVSDFFTVFG